MWTAEGLDAAVASSARWTPWVEVLTAEEGEARELRVAAGELTARRNEAHTPAATLTVIDPELPPADLGALLSPGGTELRVWLRVAGIDVPLLTGPIVSASWERRGASGGAVDVDVMARSVLATQARWEVPAHLPAGIPVTSLLLIGLLTRVPQAETRWIESDRTLARPVVLGDTPDSDPWDDLRRLARRFGWRLRTDRLGTFVLDAGDPEADAPALRLGADGLPVAGVSVTLTRERVYNGVVAQGRPRENRPPVRAVVWDTDPTSPTFADGPFGRKPRFHTSPLIRTVGQARQAARSILTWSRRALLEVEVETRPHPGLDPGDIVVLDAPEVGLSAQPLRVEEISLPLDGSAMRVRATGRRDVPEEGGDET